jgi:hypothetical protein
LGDFFKDRKMRPNGDISPNLVTLEAITAK